MAEVNPGAMRPIWETLQLICGKWRAPILCCLCGRPLRFSELEDHLDCITSKALAQHLKELEANGLVLREVLPTRPVSTRYTLTARGQSIIPLLQEVRRWGEDQLPSRP